MSENVNRRDFLKKSFIASTCASFGLTFEEKALSAAPAGEDSIKGLPAGKIHNVNISRLIIGGNQFSGWSHSRDLKYLRELFTAYSTEEKILETLQICEEIGINTIITASSMVPLELIFRGESEIVSSKMVVLTSLAKPSNSSKKTA